MQFSIKKGVSKTNTIYYYINVQVSETYSIKKFLTAEETQILKLSNVITD